MNITMGRCINIRLVLVVLWSLYCGLTSIECNTSKQQALQSHFTARITFPRLHPEHYRYFLKHHPLALKEFENICNKLNENKNVDGKTFRKLHANLTIEDPHYLEKLDYGLSIARALCSNLKSIPKICWGYEKSCHEIYLMPKCKSTNSKDDMIRWFNQADFGFIAERRLELSKYSSPENRNDINQSSLECTRYFRTCRAMNLYVDFRMTDNIPVQDGADFIRAREIGGFNCSVETKRIQEESGQRLTQSWYHELKDYKLVQDYTCDETITIPIYFIKLSQKVDHYELFKNFVYLYSTMHLYQRFYDHNQIFFWNEVIPETKLDPIWSVFSRNPPKTLSTFKGKRVCFANAIFTMPSEMDVGFYHDKNYPNCSGSGLFHAFITHVLYRLNIQQTYTPEIHRSTHNKLVRVTIFQGNTIPIDNLGELVNKLTSTTRSKFKLSVFKIEETNDLNAMLQHFHNTDVLIGLPGSDLTYSLFLPDWGVVVDVSSTTSRKYHNLAKFRGLNYILEEQSALFKDAVGNAGTNPTYTTLQFERFLVLLEGTSLIVQKERSVFFSDTEINPSANSQRNTNNDAIGSREDL